MSSSMSTAQVIQQLEEQFLVAHDTPTAKFLANKGKVLELTDGTVLTEQGKVEDQVFFILDGKVEVFVSHHSIGQRKARDSDADVTFDYDRNGNTTDDGTYEYVYDAMNRLRQVKSGATTIAEYWYNGLGYRIAERHGTSNPVYHLIYDARWRHVATFRDEDDDPKEQIVYHNAGMDGLGGSSYIDQVILRDRDGGNSEWDNEADGSMEERSYVCQNRRADSVAVLSETGRVREAVKYSADGIPTSFDPADYDGDGFVNGTDYDQFYTDYGNGDPPADVDYDGFVTGVDADEYEALFAASFVAGRGVLSGNGNRFGYAGYIWDPVVERYHVRCRVYAPELGRFLTRDPLDHNSSSRNLYEYVNSSAIDLVDPLGLFGKSPKAGKPPATPPAPGPPLNPSIIDDGGIITFDKPGTFDVDHSAFYYKDSKYPSGYCVASQQPGGLTETDMVDYLRGRPARDNIWITPVRDVNPKRAPGAIKDYKDGQDPNSGLDSYDASDKCIDAVCELLRTTGGPDANGGGPTQIPAQLRKTIKQLEDNPPEQNYPPGVRPPPNPLPPPKPNPPSR